MLGQVIRNAINGTVIIVYSRGKRRTMLKKLAAFKLEILPLSWIIPESSEYFILATSTWFLSWDSSKIKGSRLSSVQDCTYVMQNIALRNCFTWSGIFYLSLYEIAISISIFSINVYRINQSLNRPKFWEGKFWKHCWTLLFGESQWRQTHLRLLFKDLQRTT